ncbi:putative endonuclease lcl3 [Thecaphora frezii]
MGLFTSPKPSTTDSTLTSLQHHILNPLPDSLRHATPDHPTSSLRRLLSTPAAIATASVTATSLSFVVYWRYFRRIPNAEYLTPSVLRYRKTLVGYVTSVGDADGFRLFHTPGIPLLRRMVHNPHRKRKPSELRNQTLSVRLAGADAPETGHFGKPAQPFAKEAMEELKKLVLGRTVWCHASHVDQYKRLVATPYVWLPPYVLGRTNVSHHLVKRGLATVYRQSGAAYGQATAWAKIWSRAKSGLDRLERAERNAQKSKLGIWSQGTKFESPEDYKKRFRSQSPTSPSS